MRQDTGSAAVLSRTLSTGFALVRPPGHHAEAAHAMGFCLVNNAAVAAEAALRLGARRVAILDWDVHHGNGTQDIVGDDPTIFFEAVMAIARHCGASGWVSGIIGVHPWELGVCDRRVQDEMWAGDPDRWMWSTYMPGGFARPVDGGYEFTGRWQFSSGCDVSDWIILGGIVVDGDPPTSGADMAKLFESHGLGTAASTPNMLPYPRFGFMAEIGAGYYAIRCRHPWGFSNLERTP